MRAERCRARSTPTRILVGFLCLVPALVVAETGSVEVNGVSLQYEVIGSGRPLVLIHGWAVHSGYWDHDVERLAERHTVIRYDRRGCGRSTGRPDTTADPADLAALLDHLGHSRAHILGHSQGAEVALTFTARYPERVAGLILFGAPPPAGFVLPPNDDEPPVEEWVQVGQTQGIAALRMAIGLWASGRFSRDMPAEIMQRAQALVQDYEGLDLIDPAPPSNLVAPARVDELPTIDAPTLVLLGAEEMQSFQIVADVLLLGLPNARQVVLPGGGHIVNWHEPERFAAEVFRFLRDVEASRAD